MYDYRRHHAELLEMFEKQIFFIGGAMKSGTTWLQLSLDAHPRLSCGGEGHFTNQLAPRLVRALGDYNGYLNAKNTDTFNEIAGYAGLDEADVLYLVMTAIAAALRRQPKARHASAVGEKTPDNVRAFDLLGTIFPNAKFIHVVRDGRDCAVSAWFHNLRTAPPQAFGEFGTKDAYLERFAQFWSSNVGAGAGFGAQQPARYRAVRYENLLAAPELTLGGLFDFLGVETDPGILAAYRDAGSFGRLSGGRVPGIEDRQSFFRKGVAGDWPQHFGPAVQAAFEAAAGPWLDRFGYL